ncbi:hypothetical protein V6N13_032564 [Hibiscus sabdariffa]
MMMKMLDVPEIIVVPTRSTFGIVTSPMGVEASTTTLLKASKPIEEDIEIPSIFYGACYAETTVLAAEAVLTVGRL